MDKVVLANLLPGAAMDYRPVAKGNSLWKVSTTALMALFWQACADLTFPTQLGNSKKAGSSQLVFGIQMLLEANPGHVDLALDIENAFNEGERKVILEKLFADERIKELRYYY